VELFAVSRRLSSRTMRIAVCCALLIWPGWLHGQVVLSRRVYAEHGRTWQQLWVWSPLDGSLKPLTHTPRDHSQPRCSRDGKRIFFVSDGDSFDKSVWSFDRAAGEERKVWNISGTDRPDLVGLAKDGGLLILQTDGLHKGAPGPFHIAIREPEGAAVSPDGIQVVFTTGDGSAFLTDTATGKSRAPIGKCESPAWSPDGSRIACTRGRCDYRYQQPPRDGTGSFFPAAVGTGRAGLVARRPTAAGRNIRRKQQQFQSPTGLFPSRSRLKGMDPRNDR